MEIFFLSHWRKGHHLTYKLLANTKNTIILFICPPKFCINIIFIFSWDLQRSQEKLETMLMQNFVWTNKEYYGIFDTGLLPTNMTLLMRITIWQNLAANMTLIMRSFDLL